MIFSIFNFRSDEDDTQCGSFGLGGDSAEKERFARSSCHFDSNS